MENNVFPSKDQALAAAQTDTRFRTHDAAILKTDGGGFSWKILPAGSDMAKLGNAGGQVVDYYRKGQPINLIAAGGGTAKELASEDVTTQTPAVAARTTS